MAVEVDVALHAQQAEAHRLGFPKGMVQQLQPVALALVVGMYADGPESPRGEHRPVIQHNLSFGKHHMPDYPAVFLHHQVQLRDKVGIAAVAVQHIVLGASGTIDVPESLARQVLHLAVVVGLLQSNVHGLSYCFSVYYIRQQSLQTCVFQLQKYFFFCVSTNLWCFFVIDRTIKNMLMRYNTHIFF